MAPQVSRQNLTPNPIQAPQDSKKSFNFKAVLITTIVLAALTLLACLFIILAQNTQLMGFNALSANAMDLVFATAIVSAVFLLFATCTLIIVCKSKKPVPTVANHGSNRAVTPPVIQNPPQVVPLTPKQEEPPTLPNPIPAPIKQNPPLPQSKPLPPKPALNLAPGEKTHEEAKQLLSNDIYKIATNEFSSLVKLGGYLLSGDLAQNSQKSLFALVIGGRPKAIVKFFDSLDHGNQYVQNNLIRTHYSHNVLTEQVLALYPTERKHLNKKGMYVMRDLDIGGKMVYVIIYRPDLSENFQFLPFCSAKERAASLANDPRFRNFTEFKKEEPVPLILNLSKIKDEPVKKILLLRFCQAFNLSEILKNVKDACRFEIGQGNSKRFLWIFRDADGVLKGYQTDTAKNRALKMMAAQLKDLTEEVESKSDFSVLRAKIPLDEMPPSRNNQAQAPSWLHLPNNDLRQIADSINLANLESTAADRSLNTAPPRAPSQDTIGPSQNFNPHIIPNMRPQPALNLVQVVQSLFANIAAAEGFALGDDEPDDTPFTFAFEF